MTKWRYPSLLAPSSEVCAPTLLPSVGGSCQVNLGLGLPPVFSFWWAVTSHCPWCGPEQKKERHQEQQQQERLAGPPNPTVTEPRGCPSQPMISRCSHFGPPTKLGPGCPLFPSGIAVHLQSQWRSELPRNSISVPQIKASSAARNTPSQTIETSRYKPQTPTDRPTITDSGRPACAAHLTRSLSFWELPLPS